MNRRDILATASKAVCGDRQKVHGDAERNLTQTGDLWFAYLAYKGEGEMITAKDVAMMNILQKISRSCANKEHADHYVDMAGYAALAGEITKAR